MMEMLKKILKIYFQLQLLTIMTFMMFLRNTYSVKTFLNQLQPTNKFTIKNAWLPIAELLNSYNYFVKITTLKGRTLSGNNLEKWDRQILST